jgi:fructose/tagatose bisphosphate aldolase
MLSGFNDLSSLEAASANANALRTAVYKRSHRLEIWIEAAIGSIVGVADGVTKLRSFVTDFASFCHCSTPLLRLLR